MNDFSGPKFSPIFLMLTDPQLSEHLCYMNNEHFCWSQSVNYCINEPLVDEHPGLLKKFTGSTIGHCIV